MIGGNLSPAVCQGTAVSAIKEITFANSDPLERTSFKDQVTSALNSTGISLSIQNDAEDIGIQSIRFNNGSQSVEIN